MTQAEFLQQVNAMPVNEQLRLLYQAEDATKAIWGPARQYAKLYVEKQEEEKKVKHAAENYKGGCKVRTGSIIITLILALISFVLLEEDSLLRILGIFVTIFMALFTLVTIAIVVPGYKKEEAAAKAKLPDLEKRTNALMQQINELKKQYETGLDLRQLMCPKVCNDPEYMRIFVSYFENGRATNLNEATNLLETFMHRQEMRNLAQQQVYAAQDAAAAAQRAESAANAAASAARSAETQARQASYEAWRSNQ